MEILTIETASLGDRSYVLTDGEVAVVIDPQRDLDRVFPLIEPRDLRVAYVLETHVHNDYVTGGYELARRTGATYALHDADEVSFPRHGLHNSEEFSVGALTIRALHTPGHTPTHLSFVVAEGGRDAAVFTGGSLLYGAVGRTDLISRAATEELTRAQHRSALELARHLDDTVEVWPTHGFGSFCSSQPPPSPAGPASEAGGGEVLRSTIGQERRQNLALTIADEDEFVGTLLSGLDVFPRYYAHMAPRNRLGPEPVDLSPPVPADPEQLSARIRSGEWVVDLRGRTAYATDHVTGTINIEVSDGFSTYLAWLVPWGLPVTLVGDTADEVAEAQRQLVRVGIDRPAAAATGGVGEYGAGLDRASYEVATFEQLADRRSGGNGPHVLDVRRPDERAVAAVVGSQHVPLHELVRRVDEVPDDGQVWVHCASGFRAAIAASLLVRAGRRPVLLDDDESRAGELGLTG